MFDNFSERARKAMMLAHGEAQRLNSKFTDTEHILLGILEEGGGADSVAVKILKNLKVDLKRIRQEVEKLVTPSDSVTNAPVPPPLSDLAKDIIKYADESAKRSGHGTVGTEHLLLGLLGETEGIAAKALFRCDVSRRKVLDAMMVMGIQPAEGCSHKLEVKVDGFLVVCSECGKKWAAIKSFRDFPRSVDVDFSALRRLLEK